MSDLHKDMETVARAGIETKEDPATRDFLIKANNARSAWIDFRVNAESILTEDHAEFVSHTNLAEFFNENPAFLGAFLTAVLPMDGGMTTHTKKQWLEVADTLGPDWVESFKQVSLFMGRVV